MGTASISLQNIKKGIKNIPSKIINSSLNSKNFKDIKFKENNKKFNKYKIINRNQQEIESFSNQDSIVSENNSISHGPRKAYLSVYSSINFDFQPSICKDYKETGYCGYFNACKFLHDRSDYKVGWQIEKEYKEIKKNINEDLYEIFR